MEAERPLYQPSPWQTLFHSLPHDEALGAGAVGPGKALWVDTPIWTASGWRLLRDLAIGDHVFDERGDACSVVGKSDVWTDRPCYRVTFDDGSELIADAEHEWLTADYRERESFLRAERRSGKRTGLNDQRHKRRTPRVRTTREIAETLYHKGRMINHAVPCCAPLHGYRLASDAIDPYVLGAWLGDGTRIFGSLTSADPEIPARIEAAGYRVAKKGRYRWAIYGLIGKLRALGVSPSKHIPVIYKSAPRDDRMALLQGLVDTDGHVDRDGRVEVTLCDRRLADDVYELVCGLGFKATFRESDAKLNRRVVGRRWRIAWSPQGRPCAWLKRKAERLGKGQRTQRWRYIVACAPVPSVPVQCIQVDSPSHLYLAGRSLIPTHNSFALLMDPLAQINVEHERCLYASNHDHPLRWGDSSGWALHLRRTRPMLVQTIRRSQQIFPQIDPKARWLEKETTWIFQSGYRFQFGHCKDPDDWDIYFSNEFTHIAFDELIQFDEEQYIQITSRLRSSDPVFNTEKLHLLKVRACSNPYMRRENGEDFSVKDPRWVRRYFVDPAPQGKVTLYRDLKRRDGTIARRTRIYLPATLYDNPDKEFVRQHEPRLLALPPHQRKAQLEGDWYGVADAFFSNDWDSRIHVCAPFNIPKRWKRFRSMDWGFKKPGCVHWWAMDEDGNLFCEKEFTFQGMLANDAAVEARRIERGLGLFQNGVSIITGPADSQIWEQRGEVGKTKAETWQEYGFGWVPADKRSRQSNAERVMKRLRDHHNYTTTPGIVFFSTCIMAIRTLPAIQSDPDNPEIPMDGGEDHWYDSVTYACAYASYGDDRLPGRGDDDDSDWEREVSDHSDRGRSGYGERY